MSLFYDFYKGVLMKRKLYLAILACIFFSHSAKPETKQRQTSDQSHESIKSRKEHRVGKKRITQTQQQSSGFTLLDSKAPTITQQSINEPPFANRYNENKKRVNLFVTKIDFTRDGVSLFLNQTFNNREYGTEFLPYSLSHLTQFLEFAHTNKQSPEFIEGALRLFNQKIKNAPFLTASALERFLERASPHFQEQIAVTPFSLWQESKHLLSEAFREKFSFAQQDPLGFFEYVSKNLAHEVQTNMITPERVRATCMRFLSCTTDKIIWSPSDQIETWRSFKKIGDSFHELHVKKVIPDELDVNELYWSLIERYCYFLKLAGTRLSLDTCKSIKQDLFGRSIPWLLQKEQESILETKMERLTVAVLETEAKIHAHSQGIITDKIVVRNA
jgi:hypothetical protein